MVHVGCILSVASNMNQQPPMSTNKKEKVFARITQDERDRLESIARRLDIPSSQIVRDGLRERMDLLEHEMAKKNSPLVTVTAN